MQRYGADLNEIASAYPHVQRELIQGALDYYDLYPGRVDEDRARNEAALARLVASEPERAHP
jgi:uncharacterized protein (DUF433 family)